MLRSPRPGGPRRAAAALALLLPAAGLAACGDDSGDNPYGGEVAQGFKAFSVSGEVGSVPEVDWKAAMEAGKVESKTLVEGTGEPIADGDAVSVEFWLGSGSAQKKAIDTYEAGQPPAVLGVGREVQPQDQLQVITKFASENLEAGLPRGSRIAVVAGQEEAFGEAAGALGTVGIGNEDTVVLIMDVGTVAATETPTAPTPINMGPKVTGLDFSKLPKTPPTELGITTIKEGTGEAITAGQFVTADYLGALWASGKVFDESYTKMPAEFQLGIGAVIPGWDLALVGQKLGSVVVLTVPAELGYGKAGQPPDIPADTALAFVVDLKSASDTATQQPPVAPPPTG